MDSQLSGKLLLVDLVWGPIPQRGMNPLAVVESLNVIENALPCLRTGQIPVMENQGSFQQSEKALGNCVVPAVGFAAHAADSAEFRQEPLEIGTGVL